MAKPELMIESITWVEGGIAVQYSDSTDVRVGGKLMKTHVLMISGAHPDYGDDIRSLARLAERTLENALEDFDESEPWEPPDDPNDEEADDAPIRGMGD